MRLLGVDGCKGGWVVAESSEVLGAVTFRVHARFAELVAAAAGSETLLVVDIPIGLMDRDARACDRAARELLGSPRCNSVFSAPCRTVLQASSYDDACALNLAARGKSLSREAFGILPKIREVDRVVTPQHQQWIREAHPEVSFAALNAECAGLTHGKKTALGERERMALLPGILGKVDLAAERTLLGVAKVGRDDLVDALACLTTAHRILRGTSLVLPRSPALTDGRGLRMEIVA